jgi:protein transport protein SEC24
MFLAADRSITSSLQEARDAMLNVACDVLRASLSHNVSNRAFSLLVPYSLRILPLYMLSLIKSVIQKRRNFIRYLFFNI